MTSPLSPTPPSTPTPNPTETSSDGQQTPPATPDPTAPANTAPDTYVFTPAEGAAYDPALIEQATPVFKELGLTQAAADKLVALWNNAAKSAADASLAAVKTMREGWVAEVKADLELGPKLDTIKADIGRAFDSMNDPKLVSEFKAAMDLTGAGDNPAFIRAFWKMSQRMIEGKPTSGGGPSPLGQNKTGTIPKPTLAAAMYPNLPAN